MADDQEDPALRIEQIDAEMAEIDRSMKQAAEGKDEGSSEKRAELNERLQQLKAEKNTLLRKMDAAGD